MRENEKLEELKNGDPPSAALPLQAIADDKDKGIICPNCGALLEGRKCKLFCTRRGCGYQVTCSEW